MSNLTKSDRVRAALNVIFKAGIPIAYFHATTSSRLHLCVTEIYYDAELFACYLET